MPYESLHLRLAEVAAAGPGEPAAEPLHPGHPESGAVEVEDRAVALEHGDPGATDDVGDLGWPVGLVVVVAEDGDHGHREVADLLGHDLGLLDRAQSGEVPG